MSARPQVPGRIHRNPVRRAALTLALLPLLAGCGIYQSIFGAKGPPPPCPRVSVLADAANLTRFRPGEGRDLIDVSYDGRIDAVQSQCEYEWHEKTGAGSVTVEVTLAVAAERGPANRDRRGDFPYFVSITDAGRNVLNKQTFTLVVDFPGNRTLMRALDAPVVLEIPLKADEPGTDYQIFIGFQLTAEQLEYNRRRAPRR